MITFRFRHPFQVSVFSLSIRPEFSALFSPHPSTGSVSDTVNPSSMNIFSNYLDKSSIVLPNHYTKALFSGREVEELKQQYSRICSVPLSSIELQQAFKKYTMHSKQIGSYHSRSKNTATVMVSWNKDLFCSSMASEDRPARINYLPNIMLLSMENFSVTYSSLLHGSNIVSTEIILVSQ